MNSKGDDLRERLNQATTREEVEEIHRAAGSYLMTDRGSIRERGKVAQVWYDAAARKWELPADGEEVTP